MRRPRRRPFKLASFAARLAPALVVVAPLRPAAAVTFAGRVLGVGGFVARAPSRGQMDAYAGFLAQALHMHPQPLPVPVPAPGQARGTTGMRAVLADGSWVEVVDVSSSSFWTNVSAPGFGPAHGVPGGRGACPVVTLHVGGAPMSAWAAHLAANGITVLGGVQSERTGSVVYEWLYFLAPDGNIFRLRTRSGDASTALTGTGTGSTHTGIGSEAGFTVPTIRGGAYLGTFYNDSTAFNGNFNMWYSIFGLKCNVCNGPRTGKDFVSGAL